MRDEPTAFLIVAVALLTLAAVGVVLSACSGRPTVHQAVLAAVLLIVAVACEETMAWASRLRLRLSGHVVQDMLAVWIFAMALAFPVALSVAGAAVIEVYAWARQRRSSPIPPHRAAVNAANTLLTCVVTAWVFRALLGHIATGLWSLWGAVLVPAALVIYTLVNRTCAAAGLVALGRPARSVLLSRDENFMELATLCLGALAALAIADQPLLVLFVLPPMVTMQRAAAMRELETAATTDSKTGLLNAVAWEQIADRELTRASRDERAVSVLVIDIDHFKRVNDRLGHLAGDVILRQVGRLLSAAMREYDTVARFGGEEFVAVLPDADGSAAFTVAERLRARVNELWLSHAVEGVAPDQDEALAVSIGVSTSDGRQPVELHQLLAAADSALYRAKGEGRNRVCLAGSSADGQPSVQPTS